MQVCIVFIQIYKNKQLNVQVTSQYHLQIEFCFAPKMSKKIAFESRLHFQMREMNIFLCISQIALASALRTIIVPLSLFVESCKAKYVYIIWKFVSPMHR